MNKIMPIRGKYLRIFFKCDTIFGQSKKKGRDK